MSFPGGDPYGLNPYLSRHLPQGAPTSPARGEHVRLWTRRAAHWPGSFIRRHVHALRRRPDVFGDSQVRRAALTDFIPLTESIIRNERFFLNKSKRRILRRTGRQTVTGIVVNQHLNVARDEYDCLKATLYNCVQHGPSTQNRGDHPQFAAHLLGRIAHVCSINPARAAKLQALYKRINWAK